MPASSSPESAKLSLSERTANRHTRGRHALKSSPYKFEFINLCIPSPFGTNAYNLILLLIICIFSMPASSSSESQLGFRKYTANQHRRGSRQALHSSLCEFQLINWWIPSPFCTTAHQLILLKTSPVQHTSQLLAGVPEARISQNHGQSTHKRRQAGTMNSSMYQFPQIN